MSLMMEAVYHPGLPAGQAFSASSRHPILITTAPGFIAAVSASPTIPRVSGVSGGGNHRSAARRESPQPVGHPAQHKHRLFFHRRILLQILREPLRHRNDLPFLIYKNHKLTGLSAPRCAKLNKSAKRQVDEQKRIFANPAPFGQNPEGDGPASGHFHKSRAELRAGLEKHPGSYRAPVAASSLTQNIGHEAQAVLLDNQKVPAGNQEVLPDMGIQSRTPVLVHQRDHLSRRRPEKLDPEDENMPEVRGFPVRTPAKNLMQSFLQEPSRPPIH